MAGADNGTLMSAPYCDYEGYSLMCSAYCGGRLPGSTPSRRSTRKRRRAGLGMRIARMPAARPIIQSDGAHAFSPPSASRPFNRPGLRRGRRAFPPSSSGSASVR
ncbi:MAG: hypothetical protein ACLSVD_15355 [Eggerthellaceae bacterium]